MEVLAIQWPSCRILASVWKQPHLSHCQGPSLYMLYIIFCFGKASLIFNVMPRKRLCLVLVSILWSSLFDFLWWRWRGDTGSRSHRPWIQATGGARLLQPLVARKTNMIDRIYDGIAWPVTGEEKTFIEPPSSFSANQTQRPHSFSIFLHIFENIYRQLPYYQLPIFTTWNQIKH